MILQRLAEHYDRIAAAGEAALAPPGSSVQKISFCIVLEPDGTLNQFEDLRVLDGKRLRPRSLIVPGQSKPTGSGIAPCFLWDSPEYMLGFSLDPNKAARTPKTFAAFRDLHLSLEKTADHAEFSAVCNFFRFWKQEDINQHLVRLTECATHFGVFRVAGKQHFVHQAVSLPKVTSSREGPALAMCLVSGEQIQPARLHEPKIKGVAGAQTSGALLVSFNANAFTSYGKDQSFNAPVSEEVVFRYANALNHLLGQRERRITLGDATVIYWADRDDSSTELAMDALFAGWGADELPEGAGEDQARLHQARLLLSQMRSGTANAPLRKDQSQARFFILGLSPNASRLSVRLWVEADATELLRRLGEHVRDLALRAGRDDRPLPLWQIVNATGRAERDPSGRLKKFDTAGVSPQLAGDLARSVLLGTPYPQSLLATMIRRIRSDGEVAYARVSAIKAVLVRNSRLYKQSPEDQMKLDLDHEQTDAAYRCGRIFAALEKAQEESVKEASNVELNSTIKDRFFGAAAATPLLVLPRLLILHNHHLRKLKASRKRSFEILMQQIISSAPFEFPRQSTLEQQGRFIVGYFQQRQDFFKSRKNDQQISEEQSTDE